jgi:hypothetical protein
MIESRERQAVNINYNCSMFGAARLAYLNNKPLPCTASSPANGPDAAEKWRFIPFRGKTKFLPWGWGHKSDFSLYTRRGKSPVAKMCWLEIFFLSSITCCCDTFQLSALLQGCYISVSLKKVCFSFLGFLGSWQDASFVENDSYISC